MEKVVETVRGHVSRMEWFIVGRMRRLLWDKWNQGNQNRTVNKWNKNKLWSNETRQST